MRELSKVIKIKFISDFLYRFPGWVFRKNAILFLKEDCDIIYTYSFDILRSATDTKIEIPVVFHVHNPILPRYAPLLKKANVVIVSSQVVASHLKANFGIDSTYIPPAIDLELFERIDAKRKAKTRISMGISPEEKIVIFVGRLIPFKNCETLIKSLASVLEKIPETRLKIIGQGPLKSSLKRLANSLGLVKKIEFVGLKSREELSQIYKTSDLVVAPSFYESFSIVSLEALIAGVPLLISSGMTEFKRIFPEIDSFDPKSTQEISKKIIEYLNSKKKAKVEKNRFRQFSAKLLKTKYKELFYKLLEDKK